jgi:hypothetical protein
MTPGYQEILAQIGAQLKSRKKLLLQRTLMLTWPILLAIVFGYGANQVLGKEQAEHLFFSFPNILGVFGYVILAAAYSVIMNFIFEIEKRIWVDSFFDNKNLTPKQSWAIAKAMFWKAVLFRFKIFLRYYLWPIVLVFALIVAEVLFTVEVYEPSLASKFIFWSIGVFAAVFIGLIIYSYYIRIKLRYTWFIFIDTYTSAKLDMRTILSQMKELNTVMKSEAFKKALVLEFGTDSVALVTNLAVSVIAGGISKGAGLLGGGGALGQMLGGLTKTYGQELAKQATSYGNIVAMYMLYRSARKMAHGAEQSVNEFVYSLGGTTQEK